MIKCPFCSCKIFGYTSHCYFCKKVLILDILTTPIIPPLDYILDEIVSIDDLENIDFFYLFQSLFVDHDRGDSDDHPTEEVEILKDYQEPKNDAIEDRELKDSDQEDEEDQKNKKIYEEKDIVQEDEKACYEEDDENLEQEDEDEDVSVVKEVKEVTGQEDENLCSEAKDEVGIEAVNLKQATHTNIEKSSNIADKVIKQDIREKEEIKIRKEKDPGKNKQTESDSYIKTLKEIEKAVKQIKQANNTDLIPNSLDQTRIKKLSAEKEEALCIEQGYANTVNEIEKPGDQNYKQMIFDDNPKQDYDYVVFTDSGGKKNNLLIFYLILGIILGLIIAKFLL